VEGACGTAMASFMISGGRKDETIQPLLRRTDVEGVMHSEWE
jgi:hypothetical protein